MLAFARHTHLDKHAIRNRNRNRSQTLPQRYTRQQFHPHPLLQFAIADGLAGNGIVRIRLQVRPSFLRCGVLNQFEYVGWYPHLVGSDN